MRKIIGTVAGVLAVCATTIGAAQSCSPDQSGPARTASYAGDGITKFGDTGKLVWDKTYSAHYTDTTDRQNCRWSLYTMPKKGDRQATVIARGNYFSAKIRVGQQYTKDVFLKSSECGLWKPK